MRSVRIAVTALVWLAVELFSWSAIASSEYRGMPVGFTDQGAPYIGAPDAPVTLEEWSDYLCPYCLRHFKQTLPDLLDQYVRTGQVRLVFRDLPLEGLHPGSPSGHVVARCVGEQDVALYWKLHDTLFERQGEWNRLPDPNAYLLDLAVEIGAERSRLRECLDAGTEATRVEESVQLGRSLGLNGTPGFRFMTRDGDRQYQFMGAHALTHFSLYTDALVKGEPLPEQLEPKTPEPPFWARAEGLVPDPARPGYTVAGDAFRGDPDADLVIVEFIDFECAPCREHALKSLPAIDSALMARGRVMWVTKHFPLRIHPHAALAAVSAECAGNQGRFWEMHDLLYAEPERWAVEDAEERLVSMASELKLDMAEFRSCFDGRQGLEYVLQDLYDAQGVITHTPTFIILQDHKAGVIRPSPGEPFVALLSQRLALDASEDP